MKHGQMLARTGAVVAGLAVLACVSCELLGLRWDVGWEKEYPASPDCYTRANDVAPAPDGGVVVVGVTDDWGAAGVDGFVIRLDNKGNELSRKLLGGSGGDELACVRAVPESGYIACGITKRRAGWCG